MHREALLRQFKQPYEIGPARAQLKPEGKDLLIRVLAASYCHTDGVFAEGLMSQQLPRVGCHEFAGKIVGLGPDVSSELGLSIGNEVGVPGRAYHPCGNCYECVKNDGDPIGYSPYCHNAGNLGLTRDGGFQDYCLVDSRQVVQLPEGMSAIDAAPLMCAGLTIWSALQKVEVQRAKRIAIIGASGGLGHLGVQFAAKLGKQVAAVDVGEAATKQLHQIVNDLGQMGSKVQVIDALNDKAEDVLLRLIKDEAVQDGAAGAIEAAILLPESQSAFDYGMNLLANHGTMVVVSFPKTPFSISADDLVFKDKRIIGSLVGRKRQLEEMVSFAAKHDIKAHKTIFSLEQLNDVAGAHHRGGGGKAVIDMTLRSKF